MKKVKNFVDYVESGRFEDQIERLSKRFEKAIFLFLIFAMAYFAFVFIFFDALLLKEMVKGREKILAGDWFITGKWVEKKAIQIPASRYWKKSVKKVEV